LRVPCLVWGGCAGGGEGVCGWWMGGGCSPGQPQRTDATSEAQATVVVGRRAIAILGIILDRPNVIMWSDGDDDSAIPVRSRRNTGTVYGG